jgi:hypothetical protein
VQRAAALNRKKNLQGTPSPSNCNSNSFDILSDKEIMLRAGKMGVIIPDDDFVYVNLIRQLEASRSNLREKQNDKPLMIECVDGSKTPLSMEWTPEDEHENDFICVESRKSRKSKVRKSVVINRPMTRSQKKVDISTQSPGGDVKGKGKNKKKLNERGLLEWQGVGKKGMSSYLTELIHEHALDFIGFLRNYEKRLFL